MSEFLDGLKFLEAQIKSAADSFKSQFDRLTYGMLIDCLKSSDPQAVKDAIDQLVAEKRTACIAPIYLVSRAHPVDWVRTQAAAALPKLVSPAELEEVTKDKDIKAAVAALVDKYGHYRVH